MTLPRTHKPDALDRVTVAATFALFLVFGLVLAFLAMPYVATRHDVPSPANPPAWAGSVTGSR